jgi:hypothetical protein
VIPIALASDTFSIATMEIVDNAIMLSVPGAMDSGVGDVLFWGALSVALVIAGVFAFPVNRWLIARGKGHVAVHETGIHGGPNPKLIGAIAVVAAVFGTTVLVADAITNEEPEHGGGHEAAASEEGGGAESGGVGGLAVSEDGLTLELSDPELRAGQPDELGFAIVDESDQPLRDFDVEQDREMHLIVVRRDMTGFQHLHPTLGADGTWTTAVTLPEPGSYRVFADFAVEGERHTLGADLTVDGTVDSRPLPPVSDVADAGDGYEVRLHSEPSVAGEESELRFSVARNGEPVEVQPYLGADGHLVALREGDLAYLHVHPVGAEEGGTEEHSEGGGEHGTTGSGGEIVFAAEFPTAARYELFLQFKHGGKVRTAEFGFDVTG